MYKKLICFSINFPLVNKFKIIIIFIILLLLILKILNKKDMTENAKTYVCEDPACGKIFQYYSHYKRHIKIH